MNQEWSCWVAAPFAKCNIVVGGRTAKIARAKAKVRAHQRGVFRMYRDGAGHYRPLLFWNVVHDRPHRVMSNVLRNMPKGV